MIPTLKLIRTDGDMIPPWYYGITQRMWERDEDTYHIIPFNLIIRSYLYLKYLWDRLRSRPSYIDKQVQLRFMKWQREYILERLSRKPIIHEPIKKEN